MTQSFPAFLEIDIPQQLPFQFELENIPQVVFLLDSANSPDNLKFSCYLNKALVWEETFTKTTGQGLKISFPPDVLSRVKEVVSPDPNAPAPAAATAASTTAAADAAAASDNENAEDASDAANKRGPRRQRAQANKFIGKALHPSRSQPTEPMQWMSNGALHTEQGQAYRQIVNDLCYPNTRQFRQDPLHIWSFYLVRNNVAVSVMSVDTHLAQYQSEEGMDKLKQKIYRRLFSMAHYESHLDKFVKEDAVRLKNEGIEAPYNVKPVPDQENKTALAAWRNLPVNKLLRIGIPTDTKDTYSNLIRGALSYAHHLGIDLHIDRLD